MKVVHVYRTYFPDPPGGLQEAIRQICLATKTQGIETKIFTLSPSPYPRQVMFSEGSVIRSKSWAAPSSCDLGGLDALRQFKSLTAWADIVHYHFPWPFADILHLLVGRGKPSVMTYHSDILRQRRLASLYDPLMRYTLKAMSAVVATSPTYARTSPVLTQLVPRDRLRVIPLGMADFSGAAVSDEVEIDELGRLELGDRPFFLALGVLRYYKGLHTLIEAASAIDANIVIAGSGPEQGRLESQARETKVTNIIFAGQVNEREKIALLQRCRALVLPSHLRSEAFGMVLVEASMFGRPMICCEIGSGTSYINIDGETGFVVPPESPADLAQAMKCLLMDEVLADRMGSAARRRYEQHFSSPALSAAYTHLYQEVLQGGKSFAVESRS